jgi:SpoIID/LytB domain protein
MSLLGRLTALRSLVLGAVVVALVPLVGLAADPAGAQTPVSDQILVTGRGWGHGRGLGQWGAFGYATGRSGGPWSYRTILDHFYGNTTVGDIANPLAAVDLLSQRGLPLVVERAAGVTVGGVAGTSVAVRVTLRADGRFDVERAAACAGAAWNEPTIVDGPVRLRAQGTSGTAADALRLCHADGTKTGYRGELVAMGRSFDGGDVGLAQAVNLVRLDDLLRSVVPRQVPPSWATVDGGRGLQAVLAQVVAARGFAAAGDGRWLDLHSGLGATFTTCDTSSCQPYAGVESEDPLTDAAVTQTSGEVRVRDGAVIRTEFSASTGGWTAGGAFPPVADQGDAVRDNPHRLWTSEIARTAIEDRYHLGLLQAITVLERNGLGADGGRVLRLRLVGSTASVELTGTQLRSDFGLRSDWYTLTGAPPRPPIDPRSIDDACPVGEVPTAGFTDLPVDNVHRFAVECVAWWGVTGGTSPTTYGPAGVVTRGQMAAFVARIIVAAGGSLPVDPPDAFTDDDGSVHEGAIDALAALGVVRGSADGRFEPSVAVDRAQTATLVARALGQLGIALQAAPPDAFADDTGSVHELAVNQLAAEGIVTGVSAGYLQPDRSTRRDQMGSLLARSLDLIVERTGAPHP